MSVINWIAFGGILVDLVIISIIISNAFWGYRRGLVNVIFQEDTNNPIQYIIISNTYNNENLNTEKIFEKNFSTKKGNTGLGLWEVKQLLKKNNRLNLRTSKTEKYFTQKLEIYY